MDKQPEMPMVDPQPTPTSDPPPNRPRFNYPTRSISYDLAKAWHRYIEAIYQTLLTLIEMERNQRLCPGCKITRATLPHGVLRRAYVRTPSEKDYEPIGWLCPSCHAILEDPPPN